jgi:NADH:ubiquinone oxidoreductase subunit 4 (subunit M)
MQRVFLGPEKAQYKGFPEVDAREHTVLVPLTVMAILLGVLPTVFFFAYTNSTVQGLYHSVLERGVSKTVQVQPAAPQPQLATNH